MDTTKPADFRGFYRSLDADAKTRFAAAAGTSPKYIEVHLVYARRMPRPDSMERIFAACKAFGATFDMAQLIAFFYEGSRTHKAKAADAVDEAAASDDAQPPVGGSSRKTKEARMNGQAI
jgi:hypothetical protein